MATGDPASGAVWHQRGDPGAEVLPVAREQDDTCDAGFEARDCVEKRPLRPPRGLCSWWLFSACSSGRLRLRNNRPKLQLKSIAEALRGCEAGEVIILEQLRARMRPDAPLVLEAL